MNRRSDVFAIAVLALLPFLFFWPVVFGGRTLVPADNLLAWEPWRSAAPAGASLVPHNELLSDLVLENYVWKLFLRRCLDQGELPLWNPLIFTGVPFLAAGQHSALYPFSLLFYVFPLPQVYGVFSALQLSLAAVGMYLFTRAIGVRPGGAFVAGAAYAFSSFMVVSVAFTMMIAAAAWLPWCLLALEMLVRRGTELGAGLRAGVPWLVAGATFLGLQVLAGHVEITYYVLLVMGLYTAWRLAQEWRRRRSLPWRPALLAAAVPALGLTLGAVQLLPLYELVQTNFRSGASGYQVTYEDVIGWAYPLRQAATFVVPDLYGNPSIHSYLDVMSLRITPITHNALGEPMTEVAWGKGLPSWKNYVEAGSYVGILPLLLALPAIVAPRTRRQALFFALLAGASLLLVFGTPLYRLLFLLPGVDQLHSPFRWVFPYTFSLAALAGLGLTVVADPGERAGRRAGRIIGLLAVGGGLAGLGLLLLVLVLPGPFVSLADRLLASSELTRRAFADGRMLVSYQYRNGLILALSLLGGGTALLAAIRGWTWHSRRLWPAAAGAVLVADLFAIGHGFYPRADPQLLQVTPPVIRFLQEDTEPWRLTTFIGPGEKPLNANGAMLYGLEDIRGYDSIIPRQYVEFMGLVEVQDELLYNRIAPLSEPESLDSPLLDLLNVRYVLSSQPIDRPGYELAYRGELLVYRNLDHLPRAFALTRARRVPGDQLHQALAQADPRAEVLLEGPDAELGEAEGELLPVSILQREATEVLLRASLPRPAWVVLTDAHFEGWRAYVRPFGSEEPEEQRPIERAYGAFRAVELAAGDWEIRFRYMPRSFQVGLYLSFIAAVALLLLALAWLWGRYYRREGEEQTVRRVAKNSLTPMSLSLLNKLIDMAFAMLMLRLLGPAGAGDYQFAVTFIGYFEILVRFGLGTLITREVAREPEQGRRFLGNALGVRLLLWLGSLPLMALLLAAYVLWTGLTPEVVAAVAVFSVAVFLGNVADALSAVFYAHERMEHPAFVSTGTTLVKVTLGAIILLAGGGFVGLAFASIASNLFTVLVLGYLLTRDYFRPTVSLERGFASGMARESFPLMINHLLATVFFQVDVLLLQPMRGSVEVGYYGAAYRYIRGLDIIPGYFTMALFPVMSRYARSARESLQRAYRLSLRLLFLVSIPLALGTTFIARELILILAGPQYLPHSVLALQILIWYMPLGFVNSVTQYVLIALDEQRYLTRAFVIGVSFNLLANLATIPLFGYRAAAAVTVLSELALLIPFMRRVYRHLDPLPWLDLVWRPAVATLVMGLALQLLRRWGAPWPALIPAGAAVYAAALLPLGATRAADMGLVLSLFRRRLAGAALNAEPTPAGSEPGA
ncbi:MAG: oligosaccharide flippase family protein [Anaerolineae bacterium]|nr:oligosaccharide flippase family protein [Anaerolineae bacterium]